MLKETAEKNIAWRTQPRISATTLLFAIENNNIDAVRNCLEGRVNPNARDEEGDTLLNWAIYHQRKKIVELLLDYHADINLRDADETTPLIRAAAQGDVSIVQLLLKRRPKLNLQQINGATALIANVHRVFPEAVLSGGASNDVDRMEIMQITRSLIEAGSDPNIPMKSGTTVLDYANLALKVDPKYQDLIDLLVSHGAKRGTSAFFK